MEQLIKLVRTYRFTTALDQRLRLAEEIFTLIEPELRLFVLGKISPSSGEDILQETLKGIATGLAKFKGNTAPEFWAWCYRIARNKLNDQFGRQAADRFQPMPPEDLWQLVDASAQDSPISPADRLDLEYAMQLLTASKPECYEYLWQHFVFGLDYAEIANQQSQTYDGVRMKIGRCLEEAQSLVA